MRRHRWLILLLLLQLLIGLGAAAPARAQENFYVVDVVVNVLKGATAIDDTINATIGRANEILKQAKVELKVKKTNRDVSDGGDDNGKVTEAERKALVAAGAKELDAVCGKGKGYKLTIALDADVSDQSNVGRTGHGFAVTVAELLQNNGENGYNVAHEFCHAFTLGANHKVNDNTNADATGHVNDITNLMDPTIGDGTTLTPAQIAEIRKRAARRGTVKQKAGDDGAPQKQQQRAGEDVDKKSGEGGEPGGILPKSDIRRSGLFLDGGDALASGFVQMQGLFNQFTATSNQVKVFIDADANSSTGQHEIVDGLPLGAEFMVQIDVTGDGVNPIHLSGFMRNTITLQQFSLASLALETVEDIADKAPGGGPPYATPTLDQIDYEVQAVQLGALVTPLQIGVRVTDQIVFTVDEMQFQFRNWPPGLPLLTLDDYGVAPLAAVQATGDGFAPSSHVALTLGDVPVGSAITDPAGHFSASLLSPAAAGTFYFVNAQDAAGGSDFSVLHVTGVTPALPVTSPWGVAALATLLLMATVLAVRRRRTALRS